MRKTIHSDPSPSSQKQFRKKKWWKGIEIKRVFSLKLKSEGVIDVREFEDEISEGLR